MESSQPAFRQRSVQRNNDLLRHDLHVNEQVLVELAAITPWLRGCRNADRDTFGRERRFQPSLDELRMCQRDRFALGGAGLW